MNPKRLHASKYAKKMDNPNEAFCHYCGEKLPHEKCSEARKKPEPTRDPMRYLIILILLAGCQPIRITPTEGHFYFVPKGVELETTEGKVTTEHEGVWMSEDVLNEMWDAKVEN